MILTNNNIILCGTVEAEPQFSHRVFGEKFYIFTLAVKRLSGKFDYLPVIFSERLMLHSELQRNKSVCVEGQLRSYNIIIGQKSRLQLQTFAREIYAADTDTYKNEIIIEGYICKTPTYRVTPFEREITDMLIAVNRAYGKSDYIPVICWGRNARFCNGLEIGTPIHFEGRLQSRQYEKRIDESTIETRTCYEVSVSKLLLKESEEAKAIE